MRRRLARALLVPAALALGVGQRPMPTGAIQGRVEVRLPTPIVDRNPGVADLGMPKPRPAGDRVRSVVYLESAPRAAFEEGPRRRARMDQRNEAFVPHVLAISVGTTVDFPNSDDTYHNVFSLSRTKPFDLGRYAAGKSRSVVFDRPGVVRVFCDIHSHMNAFILVFSHRYFAVTDEEGRYRIDDLPAGTYTVAVWNQAVPTTARQVTVADGSDVELNVVLTRERGQP